MSKANPPHWMAMKRIMRYLKGTLDCNLCLGSKDITLRGICYADWAGVANDRRSTTCTCFLLALESFCGNVRNNQPLHCMRQRRGTWSLAIARRKRFGLNNFWRMWDTSKKDWYPSCATINDAYHLQRIPHTIFIPNMLIYNITSLERN